MVGAWIEIPLTLGTSREAARAACASLAPAWRRMPGLLRVYFLLADDGRRLTAWTLWASMDDARRLVTPLFRQRVRERFGALPRVRWYEAAAVADNFSGDVFLPEAGAG